MFKKILIANRGEIACRVIRTAQRLGIRTVAVYSAADAEALHVKQADEAFYIGPAPSSDSYLCGDKIIAIALREGVDAIHPGYGFLSENADFAENCALAGICFIGPPSAAIRQMGEKSTAKRLMEAAGVPVIPGYHADDQDLNTLQKAADKMGYPVLIKAIAGGGGKGMRVVNQAADFTEALASARREAKSSFGDDRVLLEKYLATPRHIEMQIFADAHGHALYLFERDCSIQRRHQKILEEAPATNMSETLRQAMGQAAVNAALAIDYRGAGTIEFLLEPNQAFYFMEMNTRLQVEHPVTEMITGQDLVEWQIRVAAGEPLPITQQSELRHTGHAIETRIYAEDPNKDFIPSVGTLTYLKTPLQNQHVRVDTGVTQGDSISRYYDPMIAKLITWGKDRTQALAYLTAALADFQVVGVHTNISVLNTIITHPTFVAAEFDTHFIEHHQETLLQPAPNAEIAAIAALAVLSQYQKATFSRAQTMGDAFSPWQLADSWRPNLAPQQTIRFNMQNKEYSAVAELENGVVYRVIIDNDTYSIKNFTLQTDSAILELHATINDRAVKATIVPSNQTLHIFTQGQHWTVLQEDFSTSQTEVEDTHHVNAPMPGTLTEIFVNTGQVVKKGERLLVVEAMKMEHTLYAPIDGKIQDIFYTIGDAIEEGAQLIAWEEGVAP